MPDVIDQTIRQLEDKLLEAINRGLKDDELSKYINVQILDTTTPFRLKTCELDETFSAIPNLKKYKVWFEGAYEFVWSHTIPADDLESKLQGTISMLESKAQEINQAELTTVLQLIESRIPPDRPPFTEDSVRQAIRRLRGTARLLGPNDATARELKNEGLIDEVKPCPACMPEGVHAMLIRTSPKPTVVRVGDTVKMPYLTRTGDVIEFALRRRFFLDDVAREFVEIFTSARK